MGVCLPSLPADIAWNKEHLLRVRLQLVKVTATIHTLTLATTTIEITSLVRRAIRPMLPYALVPFPMNPLAWAVVQTRPAWSPADKK